MKRCWPKAALTVCCATMLLSCGQEKGVSVYNTPPSVSIVSPPDGVEEDEGVTIIFEARVGDDIDSDTELDLVWQSDIDNVLTEAANGDGLGNVQFSTANLSIGNHIITLIATDSYGESGSDSIEVTIIDVPDAPEMTILSPIAGEYGIEDEAFEFWALVSDLQDAPEDLYISFHSDLEEGAFCEPVADAGGIADCEAVLSVGGHTLTYRVEDLDGYTAEATQFFEIIAGAAIDDDGDGYTENMGDCDDNDASVHPGAEEFYNGVDDDCDDEIDEDTVASDDDFDGQTELEGDCDDADDDTYEGAPELCDGIDNDCDGDIDEGTECVDDDGDGFTEIDGDCDDASTATYPGAVEAEDGADNDCDGLIDEGTGAYDDDGDCFCESATCVGTIEPACTSVLTGDCDDDDIEVSPSAVELCDELDNDCDGDTDEDDADDAPTWYWDDDLDGYADPATTTRACVMPAGFYATAKDCDDTDPDISPLGTELCDGDDNDCDGDIDEADAADAATWYEDFDTDTWGNADSTTTACSLPAGFVAVDGDCDDTDADISPDADEICDFEDNDCDEEVDEDEAVDATTYYEDDDGDGFGDPLTPTPMCWGAGGYVTNNSDCDDTRGDIKPGVAETCDEVDNNCDGSVDEGVTTTYYEDGDGDSFGDGASTSEACSTPKGYVDNNTDCDDGDYDISPLATETCDGADNNCDGTIDEDTASDATTWFADDDGDGWGDSADTTRACSMPAAYAANGGDCDDLEAAAYPGASEACDGFDNNCDGTTDESGASGCTTWYYDGDGDSYGATSSQCLCSASGDYDADNSEDCYDGNYYASPAATSYSSSHRGDGSYDYNCDGTESKGYTSTYSCSTDWDGFSCDGYTEGYSSVPGCGSSGTYKTGCSASWWSCSNSGSYSLTQVCR